MLRYAAPLIAITLGGCSFGPKSGSISVTNSSSHFIESMTIVLSETFLPVSELPPTPGPGAEVIVLKNMSSVDEIDVQYGKGGEKYLQVMANIAGGQRIVNRTGYAVGFPLHVIDMRSDDIYVDGQSSRERNAAQEREVRAVRDAE